jgi:putative aldouronate transport system permease protein
MGTSRIVKEIRRNKYLYILMLPGLSFLLVFSYLPIFGYLLAFKRYSLAKGILGSKWVGFANFKFFFEGNDWILVTTNTIVLNLLFILLGIGFSVILALLLNEMGSLWVKRIAQSFIFLPYFVSWLVVNYMIQAFLDTRDGIVNNLLAVMGSQRFGMPELWRGLLVILYIWKFAGYYSIIFLAAITIINPEYYDCAIVDGASRLQQIRHITLPLMMPTITVILFLSLGRIFYGDFGMIYGIVGDNSLLFSTTDVIDTYCYRALRVFGDFSKSSAVTLYQAAMGVVTVVLFNWLIKKIQPEFRMF